MVFTYVAVGSADVTVGSADATQFMIFVSSEKIAVATAEADVAVRKGSDYRLGSEGM